MSVGERVTDLVAKPVIGTAKGIVTGAKVGAVGGGAAGVAVGGVAGAIAGGLSFLVALGTPAGLAVGLMAAVFFSHAILAGLVAATVITAVGAVAGGLGLGLPAAGVGAFFGLQAGGVLGLLKGTFKGIKSFFSGRNTAVVENEQQLRVLREEAIAEQAKTAAYLRQQERANAMDGVNPNAPDNNVTRLQSTQQSPSVPAPSMPS